MKNIIIRKSIIILLCCTFVFACIPSSANANGASGSSYNLRFINAANSSQELNYIIYTPNNVNESTPLLLFLHGDGDVNQSFSSELKRYNFWSKLKNGEWQPNFIIVMPIGRKTGNWAKEQQNINILLVEVINNFGGSSSNMYIAGASAGSDGLTSIASNINFKGAIYMAGHLNGKKGKMSAKAVMKLWSDKPVYYYRDNLYKKGGYGYNKDFIESCYNLAPSYNVSFSMIDLNWNHDYGLVDATFLPSTFTDANGNPCHDGIQKLIYR